MSKVTMKDIAKTAGVSQPAVSYVLNNKDYMVGADTRARILKVVRELNYRPNLFAKTLKTGRTNMIGVQGGINTLFGAREPYMAKVYSGIGDFFSKHNYRFVFNNFSEETALMPDTELSRSQMVDGVVYVLHAVQVDHFVRETMPLVKTSGMPFSVVHSLKRDLGCHNTGVDVYTGALELTRHLVKEHRYSTIGFIRWEKNNERQESILHGFEDALREYGVPCDPKHIYTTRTVNAEDGYQLGVRLAEEKNNLPRTLMVNNDFTAYGLIEGLRENGVRVPEDVAVTGFGDDIESRHTRTGLTTVKQPAFKKGKLAAEMLLDQIQSPEDQKKEKFHLFQTEPVIRRTCGCTG